MTIHKIFFKILRMSILIFKTLQSIKSFNTTLNSFLNCRSISTVYTRILFINFIFFSFKLKIITLLIPNKGNVKTLIFFVNYELNITEPSFNTSNKIRIIRRKTNKCREISFNFTLMRCKNSTR